MYFCDNYLLAVVFCVVTMFCWGSWGNTQKLAGKTWRYELFYWDYVIGILLFSLAMGLTMGSCVWRYDPSSPSCRIVERETRQAVAETIDSLMLAAERSRAGRKAERQPAP